jgi:hypothetical protein
MSFHGSYFETVPLVACVFGRRSAFGREGKGNAFHNRTYRPIKVTAVCRRLTRRPGFMSASL